MSSSSTTPFDGKTCNPRANRASWSSDSLSLFARTFLALRSTTKMDKREENPHGEEIHSPRIHCSGDRRRGGAVGRRFFDFGSSRREARRDDQSATGSPHRAGPWRGTHAPFWRSRE